MYACCRVDFHTQEHDPAAKECHEDSQKLQEAVAQIFSVNGKLYATCDDLLPLSCCGMCRVSLNWLESQ